MFNFLKRINYNNKLEEWVRRRYLHLSLFSIISVLLLLLRSAGYFEPYFLLSINVIIMIALLLAVFLLGLGSRFLLVMALFFWTLSGIFLASGINVWAERAGIYFYQTLVIAVIKLIIDENTNS